MPMPETRWSDDEASLLTMLSSNRGAMSLGGLLLRSDRIVRLRSREAFAESMGRLVAADLVLWLGCRFLATAAGRALTPDGEGRYFTDLVEETRVALDDQVPRPQPSDLGLTRDDYDTALAFVAEEQERQRTRRGRTGRRKWAEWSNGPPLEFGDCIEFLTFSEGREIVVKLRAPTGDVRFEGRVGLLLAAQNDASSVLIPVREHETDGAEQRVCLSADRFTTATYSSFDGLDYFRLDMAFGDSNSMTISDHNAATI